MREDLGFENLVYDYPRSAGRHALAGATGQFQAGSAIGLVGAVGAGKSTLSKVLCGVLRAQEGTIRIGDRPVYPFNDPGRWVAYSFQNPDDQLFLSTVRKEIAFGPESLGLAAADVETGVSRALELFGLQDLAERHPLELPLVFRKRVTIAGVVAARTAWTILDEPTIGQDSAFCDQLVRISKILLAEGRGLIIISHDVEFVYEVAQYFAIMSAGRCVWAGSREQLIQNCTEEVAGFINVPGRLVRALRLPADLSTRTAMAAHVRDRIHERATRQDRNCGQ